MNQLTVKDIARFEADPMEFFYSLNVDIGGKSRSFREVCEPWQKRDLSAVAPALRLVAGVADDDGGGKIVLQHWREYGRGHAKTWALMVFCLYLICISRRKLTIIVAAGDKNQARLVRDSAIIQLRLSEWLADLVEVQQYAFRGRPGESSESTVEIISADADTAMGLSPDALILDELTSWGANHELWDSLYSATVKRENCFVCVGSNAGQGKGVSWQWKLRESARTDPAWNFSSLDGPQATWLNQEKLRQIKKSMSPVVYMRVIENLWTTHLGMGLNESNLEFALSRLSGPEFEYTPGFKYGAGLDLSVTRDWSAFVIVKECLKGGQVSLVKVTVWKPSKERKIDFDDVKRTIVADHKRYHIGKLKCDQYQGEYLVDLLVKVGIRAETETFNLVLHDRLALNLQNQLSDGNLALYRDSNLERDLRSASIVETSNGRSKLVSPKDDHTGHGDSLTAFALALLAVKEARTLPAFGRPIGIAGPSHRKTGMPDGQPPLPMGTVQVGNVRMTAKRQSEILDAILGIGRPNSIGDDNARAGEVAATQS